MGLNKHILDKLLPAQRVLIWVDILFPNNGYRHISPHDVATPQLQIGCQDKKSKI